jgi:hypothetical protein
MPGLAPARPRRHRHVAPAGRWCPVTGWGRGCRGPGRRRLPGPAPEMARWGPGRCRCRVRTGSTPAGAHAAGNRTPRAPAPGCPLTSPSFIALNVNSTSVAAGSPELCHASGQWAASLTLRSGSRRFPSLPAAPRRRVPPMCPAESAGRPVGESHRSAGPGAPSLAVASTARNGPTWSPSWAGWRKELSGFTL